MKAGAVDFIEKPFDEEAILNAVQSALDRGATEEDGDNAAVAAKLATLSERERQVLEGLVAGHPNKTIAYDLGISPRTVEVYRANLMTKMGARSLSELIRMAIAGKVNPPRRATK
jgi:two-component system response regulator FixJ